MITIIDKDGKEFVPGSNAVTLQRNGRHDVDVVVYRNRDWLIMPLSSLVPGDFFRKVSDPTSLDKVYVVTKKPRVYPKHMDDPDIYLEGLTASTLKRIYETHGEPSLSRKGIPFSPSLVRLPG